MITNAALSLGMNAVVRPYPIADAAWKFVPNRTQRAARASASNKLILSGIPRSKMFALSSD